MTLDELAARIAQVPRVRHRRIIAIAGPPASGKSTIAEQLAERIPNACVVPMDGFHLDNETLDRMGQRHRKGAAHTFDAGGFVALVRSMQKEGPVLYPLFDRTRDCVVPNASSIPADCDTVIVEGNYLLLTDAPWDALTLEWDFSVYLDVPMEVLRARLIQRWLDHGLNRQDAVNRAESNDLINAEFLGQFGERADLICPILSQN